MIFHVKCTSFLIKNKKALATKHLRLEIQINKKSKNRKNPKKFSTGC